MLTFILIGGLVWLAVALVFVLALAASARKQVSPVAVNSPAESQELEIFSPMTAETSPAPDHHSVSIEESIATHLAADGEAQTA